MATNQSKKGPDIKVDDFTKHVRPQPNNTEPIVQLQGYIGDAEQEDQVRIYSDDTLTEYVDVSRGDVRYAVPNSDDPLGGSRLWINQSATASYNDLYMDGDLYKDYMQNMYGGSDAVTAIPKTLVNCPGPILTRPIICFRPTRFVCPISRRVICTIRITRDHYCQPSFGFACPQPSVADGCATYGAGCDVTHHTVFTQTINQQTGAEYASGEMYGDYMDNMYTADEASNVGVSPKLITIYTVTRPIICLRITRTPICRPTRNNIKSICRPCYEVTITDNFYTRTRQTIVNADYADYQGGDLYEDYMDNAYTPTQDAAASLYVTRTIPCRPTILPIRCHSRVIRCTINITCITPRNIRTICRPCPEVNPNDLYYGY